MGNLNLFDVIEEAAATSPTLGVEPAAPPKPLKVPKCGEPKEPEPVRLYEEISLANFDADGNPIIEPVEPNPFYNGPERSLCDVYAAQVELDAGEFAEAYGEAGPPVPADPDLYGILEKDDHDEDVPDEHSAGMMVDDWKDQEDDDEPDEVPVNVEPEVETPRSTVQFRAVAACSHEHDTYNIVAERVHERWEVAAERLDDGKEVARKILHYARSSDWITEAAKRNGARADDFLENPAFADALAAAVVERIKTYGWEVLANDRLDLVVKPL